MLTTNFSSLLPLPLPLTLPLLKSGESYFVVICKRKGTQIWYLKIRRKKKNYGSWKFRALWTGNCNHLPKAITRWKMTIRPCIYMFIKKTESALHLIEDVHRPSFSHCTKAWAYVIKMKSIHCIPQPTVAIRKTGFRVSNQLISNNNCGESI